MLLKTQSGYALITTVIVILLAISITAFVTMKSMRYGQVEENNETNQQLAFQAAEAGLEYGIAYLLANRNIVLADANGDGFIDGYSDANLNNTAFGNNTTYKVTFINPVVNNFGTIQVTSQGTANNGAATRSASQLVRVYPLVPTTPPAAFIAKGSIDFGGSVEVTVANAGGATIWSGEEVTLSGNAGTVGVGGVVSDKNVINTDVIQNDAGLDGLTDDQFFSGFFGKTKSEVQQSTDLVYNYSSDSNISATLDGVTGKSIWINQTSGEARMGSNATIGSATNPVVLIVNGSFKVTGNVTVFGMVYVIGDWDNSGSGNLTVNGSMVVEGDASATGSPNINYSASVLSQLSQIGAFSKVAGSWRDF